MCPTTPAVLCLVFMAKALAQSPLATTSPPTYSVEGRSNGTIGLLRERELLLARVAAIDSEIEHERNLKRRALTEAYERAMRALDDEFATKRGTGDGSAGDAAIELQQGLHVAATHGSERTTGHQDIAHQDISVTMLHVDKDAAVLIDQDGDGRISRDEVGPVVRAAHRDAALEAASPALLGCTAGILCYILLRCATKGIPISWGRMLLPHAARPELGRGGGEAAGVARQGVPAECVKRKAKAVGLATAC